MPGYVKVPEADSSLGGDYVAAIPESELSFDTVAGHDHDGVDSKLITAGGDMLKATYDPNADGVIVKAQLDSALANTSGTNTGDQTLAGLGGIAHSLATAINDFLVASGTGVFVKKTLAEVKVILDWAADIATHAAIADSTTVSGHVEAAIASEVTTGTDTARAVTPDALAGSDYGKRVMQVKVYDDVTAMSTGDGKFSFCIPPELNGYNLVDADAYVTTASTSGIPDIDIYNVTQAAEMFTVGITIDQDEFSSYAAATGVTIDTNNDDVATGDILRVDVITAGTGAKGLGVNLTFQLP